MDQESLHYILLIWLKISGQADQLTSLTDIFMFSLPMIVVFKEYFCNKSVTFLLKLLNTESMTHDIKNNVQYIFD